jgi:hypothetical protein
MTPFVPACSLVLDVFPRAAVTAYDGYREGVRVMTRITESREETHAVRTHLLLLYD